MKETSLEANTVVTEAARKVERAVGQMYSTYPFPKRNAFGIEKMNRDFVQNLQALGLDPEMLRGRRVLDAGCGTGELSCFMARLGAEVTGMDISTGSLAYAREQAQAQKLSIQFLEGSLLDTPFELGSFDVVVSNMVLHHTPDPARAFVNIARTLTPRGTIIIRVFCLWGRMSPFQKSPLWKVRVTQWIAGKDPDRRVRVAEKLFYRPGHEVPHGIDKQTYLHDNFGVPHASHHTYGQILRWFQQAGIEYVSSNPPMELSRFLAPFLIPKRSFTWRGQISRNFVRLFFGLFPIHRLSAFQRPGRMSRAVTQFFHLFLSGSTMYTVMGVKSNSSAPKTVP